MRVTSERVGRRFNLVGRVALIVGGSKGIGFAIANGFAEAGADIAIVGRTLSSLEKARSELALHGGRVHIIQADMSDPIKVSRLIDRVCGKLGAIHILVNCASVKPATRCDVLQRDQNVLDELWGLNVKTYFDLSIDAAREMKRIGWGRIINVSSAIGLKARRGVGEYGITKAAELMMSRVFALELGEFGITVNSLVPILTRTEFSVAALADDAAVQEVLDMQVLGRVAEPDDLVGAALLLASEAGSFITGTALVVDGGASA